MRLLGASLLIMLPAVPVHAQTVDGAKTESSKTICKADPEDTDSRIRRRICKTEAEWNGTSTKKVKTDRAQGQGQ